MLKRIKIVQSLALLTFLAAGLFNFGFVSTVYASNPCNLGVLFGMSQTTITKDSKVPFNLSVSLNSHVSACGQITVMIWDSSSSGHFALYKCLFHPVNKNPDPTLSPNYTGTYTFPVSADNCPASFDFSNTLYSPGQTLKLVAAAARDDYTNYTPIAVQDWDTQSGAVTVTYSGGGASSFNPSVTLSPPKSGSSYSFGETLTVTGNNFPSGSLLSFVVNGKYDNNDVGQGEFWIAKIPLDAAHDFKDSSDNEIDFKIIDGNGNALKNASGDPVKVIPETKHITIGSAPATPTAPAATGPNALTNPKYDCAKNTPQSDPNNYALYCIVNPLPVDALTDMLLLIMRGFLFIVALWAVVFIIVGGFQMVMAAGNEETYMKGRKTITWAIIGLVIAMLSFSIVAIVQNLIGSKAPVVSQERLEK